MGRIRNTLALAAVGAALTAANGSASAAEPPAPAPAVPAPPAGPPPQPASTTTTPAVVKQGDTLVAPAPEPQPKQGKELKGGGTPAKPPKPTHIQKNAPPESDSGAATAPSEPPAPSVPQVLSVPSLPPSSCAATGVPPILIPIYQQAAAAYGLGSQGAAILAAINAVETAFGTNLNVSSAGAVGWMQFMPSTWESYGVDANGDGVRDPYNPEDAIFAAARYLSAAGMPEDTYGAIYAYNHADWYVAEVLSNASCYSGVTGPADFSLEPQLQVLSCKPAPAWHRKVPRRYLNAFETAAARYGLGKRGVWALAAVARLESDFGRGMGKRQLRETGPLGLDAGEWRRYAVDGSGDGRVRHQNVADSAATLARLIWSRGSLRAGVFRHNQAQWYVQAVLASADQIEGKCDAKAVDWTVALPDVAVAPINWNNLTLSNSLERSDILNGALDPRIVGLIGAITQQHTVTITALRSDHSMLTTSGNVSNHYYGRAMDIAEVDGVSCTDTEPTAPCAELGETLAHLPAPAHPTELIYCFDLDGPGPAFALPDHCNHVHVGYYG